MIDYNNKDHIFSKKPKTSNPFRIFFGLLIILGLFFILKGLNSGQIKPAFSPTSTPTRSLESYAKEGDTHFQAGDLEKAIDAYKNAVKVDPENTELWAELARIQVYSTTQLTTDTTKRDRLNEAFATIENGLAVNAEDSMLHAVRAFVCDWYGSSAIAGEDWQKYLNEGESEAVQALTLDSTNAEAKAYYAELLVDQQKWSQAEQYINQALESGEEEMDIFRIAGYVQESLGNYTQAIEYYKKAITLTPNLNMLYISMGANYRTLAGLSNITTQKNEYYDQALAAFAKAVEINNKLGVKDSIPLISIANTYVQQGEFFAAIRNMIKGVQYNPTDPTVYGELGIMYYKARNYEGAIPALRCYVRGCTAAESCLVRNGGEECDPNNIPDYPIEGQPLSDSSVAYYFTYGEDLAIFGECDEALVVLAEVEAGFSGDETVMSIVNDGRDICSTFSATPVTPTVENSNGTSTVTPTSPSTLTPTSAP